MLAKKILMLIKTSAVVVVIVCCISSCEKQGDKGLLFVGKSIQRLRLATKGLVVVTHGWIEKGRGGWPEDMVLAIEKRIGSDVWSCVYLDWTKGAKTLNPTDAAKYARDIAGPRLGEEISELKGDFTHIHLVAHSSGCWAISEAAKIVAEQTKADIHLTFLDAYVPALWDENKLGDVDTAADVNCWIEHYYTRDYTLGWTQQELSHAHNVDITNVDQGLKDHNFPRQWYYATIIGKYLKHKPLNNRKLVLIANGIEYGFARSREAAGANGWKASLRLPIGNKAVKLKKH